MIKLFLDSSDIEMIKKWEGKVDGFTTNPTLMKKAGITDYEKFCKEVLEVTKKPVSFEVFADEFDEMERQARIISSWGENVFVKIPITNSKGESSLPLIGKLKDIKLNITAIMTSKQVFGLLLLECSTLDLPFFECPMIVSVFAGRIADTGEDPMPVIKNCALVAGGAEILWASPREVLNIYQAEEAGADIITVTPELLEKYEKMKGKDLDELSLDTVKMFYNDAKEAGYKL